MAIQSLYRQYRPKRFSELKGQDHVVRALRNAVINQREGQAYLFSGPRGTGKTSTARILAKVLNCENLSDGEPCGVCNSCLSIDSGSSYDVLELDAASNNGVDNMRDLIERAALGNPGRHRVFILDEVHMLSKPAEAALLKTLEEPPDHVVFVLATTDPQKVSETIRSRTQHLQFHLLTMSEMRDHIDWVVADAKLVVSKSAIDHVVQLGGGSVRDTLSALELVVASGGYVEQQVSLDEFIEAFIDNDPGRALAAVSAAIQLGADPRSLTEELVRHLRDSFLSLMAPGLVQLVAERAEVVGDQARRMGATSVVRAIEMLGDVLIEIRHAPDARLLLEVAMVKLTRQNLATDIAALTTRIERLETDAAANRDPSGSLVRPAIVDSSTGRAKLGARATPLATAKNPAATSPSSTPSDVVPAEPTVQPKVVNDSDLKLRWSEVVNLQKGLAGGLLRNCLLVNCQDGLVTLSAQNAVIDRLTEHVEALHITLRQFAGRPIKVDFIAAEPSRGTSGIPTTVDDEDDHVIDMSETTPAPPNGRSSQIDELAKAFPGSQIIDNKK